MINITDKEVHYLIRNLEDGEFSILAEEMPNPLGKEPYIRNSLLLGEYNFSLNKNLLLDALKELYNRKVDEIPDRTIAEIISDTAFLKIDVTKGGNPHFDPKKHANFLVATKSKRIDEYRESIKY